MLGQMLGWRGGGGGGHLYVWPDLTVSADLSFLSTFIFDVLHSSDICWDRCWVGVEEGGGHLHVWPDLTVSADLSFVSTFIFDVLHSSDHYLLKLISCGVGGHLHIWPDLTVSADLSFVSIFIFDVLHSSDICWDRCWAGVEGGGTLTCLA